MVDGSKKCYHELSLNDLSSDKIRALFPPGTVVTKTHDDFPFGTTVDGQGVYVNPKSNTIHVKEVNGNPNLEADWVFTTVYIADH